MNNLLQEKLNKRVEERMKGHFVLFFPHQGLLTLPFQWVTLYKSLASQANVDDCV